MCIRWGYGGIGSRQGFQDILRLAKQGDRKACKANDQMAHYLGCGIAMLVSGLAPEVTSTNLANWQPLLTTNP